MKKIYISFIFYPKSARGGTMKFLIFPKINWNKHCTNVTMCFGDFCPSVCNEHSPCIPDSSGTCSRVCSGNCALDTNCQSHCDEKTASFNKRKLSAGCDPNMMGYYPF